MSSNRYRVENQDYDFEEVPADGKAFEDFVETNRRGIEPWLSAIFQSEHLALLAGSGLTTGLTRTVGVAAVEMEKRSFLAEVDAKIDRSAEESARRIGRGAPNLEDQIRACISLLAGLEILGDARAEPLRLGLRRELVRLANSIVDMEAAIL